ncbi:MAG: methylmalonyl Co-A mutase-associated GTPase MeaB [Cyclobacteriaceae bacterium]|nr:methylmalonyl Co-A mutase-associated GTPase MeaB [Cyclobacteriaceae bacterium]
MSGTNSSNADLKKLAQSVLEGDRWALGRAITLIESKKSEHRQLASVLLEMLLPATGNSTRIGVTGVPGAGKSTFIDVLGTYLTSVGKKPAVLTIDPSSARSKGSILGDKTRMEQLARDTRAFIRPSPAGTQLGGVAQHTRETILLCEAAGFDVVIIETVGVGQSETFVREMVDFFLLLLIPGGGDELQGIKRGIMEMADMVLINKSDGDYLQKGREARHNYQQALHLFPPHPGQWTVPVETVSAIEKTGIEAAWDKIETFVQTTRKNGYFDVQRKQQNLQGFRDTLRRELELEFYARPSVKSKRNETEALISSGQISVRKGIERLMEE